MIHTTMKKAVICRFPLLVFVICFVSILYMSRKVRITIANKGLDVNDYRQQGHQAKSSRSLVRNETNLGLKGTFLTSNISFIHLVIQFPLLLNVSTNDTKFVRERQQEYIQTLRRNLAHALVKRVHILCENDQTVKFILQNFTLTAQKLVLKNIGRRMLYSDALEYVSNQLLFETSIIMNADLYIGKGFEKIDPKLLNGTVYALTRHESKEKMKACPGRADFCTNMRGSHDAFVMHLVRPLPDELLQKTTFLPDMNGAENVFIYMLETYGHFRFKNPCSILYIIHNHCINRRTDFVGEERLESLLKVPGRSVGSSGL